VTLPSPPEVDNDSGDSGFGGASLVAASLPRLFRLDFEKWAAVTVEFDTSGNERANKKSTAKQVCAAVSLSLSLSLFVVSVSSGPLLESEES